ncbi:MAG: DNA repair protein RecN, partial [Streptococcaceae bacterium]|nr:DNA repair protein RecN [Streptococcaceae bacterium]
MLQEIVIKNFAIIPELSLSFKEGLSVLTGETGAGKSIIMDALGLLIGARGRSEFIRDGEEKAVVQGLFRVSENNTTIQNALHHLGIEWNEGELLLQRDLNRNGKSVSRINGQIVTLQGLKSVGVHLVDIQGQHDHQDLMDETKHLELLDGFGGTALQEAKTAYLEKYTEYAKKLAQYKTMKRSSMDFEKRLDMLNFQSQEIAEANLERGEEETLEEELEVLSNFQEINAALVESNAFLLEGETTILSELSSVLSKIESIRGFSPKYEGIYESLENGRAIIEDAAHEISNYADADSFDEARLFYVEERIGVIQKLKKKYGESIADILNYYDEITTELSDMTASDKNLETLEMEAKLLRKETWVLGEALSAQRQAVSSTLRKDILRELRDLYMEKSDFQVAFQTSDYLKVQADGIDSVEFYLTTNQGESLKPLVLVASGGEMSRVLLALKTIFSKNKKQGTIVFDEI